MPKPLPSHPVECEVYLRNRGATRLKTITPGERLLCIVHD